tara:strand:- start:1786 stop:1947 length:162 start_codon:yes stop_codon:yes gene_type:complete
MKFFALLKHLITSVWKNASPVQAALITAFLIVIVIIVIISVVQVLVPFTYIAI